MSPWHRYIEDLLETKVDIDDLWFSVDEGDPFGVPPLIKSSLHLLEKMQEFQCAEGRRKLSVLVFPEKTQATFLFTVTKILYNIFEGKISWDYNLDEFTQGDRLKIGNAVVEVVRVEESNGRRGLKIRHSDMIYWAPEELLPFFQKTNTGRRLSPYAKYLEEKKKIEKEAQLGVQGALRSVLDYKTHMDSSILAVTVVSSMTDLLSRCRMCDIPVKEALLVGRANYEGSIESIGPGQMDGVPAVVLASDLYAAREAIERGAPVQSIIIDVSNANALFAQLDVLDDLIRHGLPITCVTDVVNSFDLTPLVDRNFDVWRWDSSTLIDALAPSDRLRLESKARNYIEHQIKYSRAESDEICLAVESILLHRKELDKQSLSMMNAFEKLYALAFHALHAITPFTPTEISTAKATLSECLKTIEVEERYLPESTFCDYLSAISSLDVVYSESYVLPKKTELEKILKSNQHQEVCIVVSEKADTKKSLDYWSNWCSSEGVQARLTFLRPGELYSSGKIYETVVVVGWFIRAIMRKTLYGLGSSLFNVLLYECEIRWNRFDTGRWNKALSCSTNEAIVEKILGERTILPSSKLAPSAVRPHEDARSTSEDDDFGEIEKDYRESRYRRFALGGAQSFGSDVVEAIPVSYVGGTIAFYRLGHKVVSATKLIANESDQIEKILPADLRMGDFVVVRKKSKDMIEEIADGLLEKQGRSRARELSGKWKEALEIEKVFSTTDEIYEKLKAAGCKRGYQTVSNWLSDDETIAPKKKEDLKLIAQVTESEVLGEMLDDVFEAAHAVRSAHQQAGRVLSEQLRSHIVGALDEYGDIDPHTIWSPIEVGVEGVGDALVLKVVHIGSPVLVSYYDTNRLIES